MMGFDAISQARWASLAAGRAGPPTIEEWPAVLAVLILLAIVGGKLMRLVGLTRVESVVLSGIGPLLVLVDVPLGAGGDGVRILANATGCLIPLLVALIVVATRRSAMIEAGILLLAATTLAFFASRVVPSRGVLLNFQACALGIGVLAGLLFHRSARLAGAWAFTAAAIGTLIGADLLHLRELLLIPNAAAITLGGAGLLDGILLTSVASAFVGALCALVVKLFVRAPPVDEPAPPIGWLRSSRTLARRRPVH